MASTERTTGFEPATPTLARLCATSCATSAWCCPCSALDRIAIRAASTGTERNFSRWPHAAPNRGARGPSADQPRPGGVHLGATRSTDPELSSTTSATARRCSSQAWAAIRARAVSASSPRAGQPPQPQLQRRLHHDHRVEAGRPARSPPAAARPAPPPPLRRPPPQRSTPRCAPAPAGARSRSGRPAPPGRRTPAGRARAGPGRRPAAEHAGPEPLHHPRQPRAAHRHHLAGQQVGVDHHRAQLGQPGRHRALAAADPAGQPDPAALPRSAGAARRRGWCGRAQRVLRAGVQRRLGQRRQLRRGAGRQQLRRHRDRHRPRPGRHHQRSACRSRSAWCPGRLPTGTGRSPAPCAR